MADARAIATIQIDGWRAAYRGLVPDPILDGFDLERRTSHWRSLIETAEKGPSRVWVAALAADGHVIGFAGTGPGRDESAPPPDGAGEIYAIYIAPEVTGRGHGRALFDHAVADLTGRAFDPIVVWVFEANPGARRFYEAAGFAVDGARHTIDFDGLLVDEIRYRLDRG